MLNLIPLYARWIALAALCAALVGFGYVRGMKHVKAEWNAEKVAQQEESRKEEKINRAKELSYQQKVIEAQNANQDRIKKLQTIIANTRSESDGLRNDLATINSRLSTASEDAIIKFTRTTTELLAECTERYSSMAWKADVIWSERQTLIDAWPK